MKKLVVTLSTLVMLSFGTTAIAGEEAEVTVIDSGIIQIQEGHGQKQDAIIGLVSNEFHGHASITVKRSLILQAQAHKDNKQTARIGIIGCDCDKH